MDDIFNLLTGLLTGPGERIAETIVRGVTVSTVVTSDLGPETAIFADETFNPVERYPTRETAIEGHEKWVGEIEGGRTRFTRLGYGILVEPEEFQITPGD